MISGYVTFQELQIITGFSEKLLLKLIQQGLNQHELELNTGLYKPKIIPIKEQLFNLEEIEKWIGIHIF